MAFEHVVIELQPSEPSDAEVAEKTLVIWLDDTGGSDFLRFKVKLDATTIKSGILPIV